MTTHRLSYYDLLIGSYARQPILDALRGIIVRGLDEHNIKISHLNLVLGYNNNALSLSVSYEYLSYVVRLSGVTRYSSNFDTPTNDAAALEVIRTINKIIQDSLGEILDVSLENKKDSPI